MRAKKSPKLPVVLTQSEIRDVRTTQIYTHVLQRGGRGVISPLSGVL
ncbi:MAG: hypothetical protein AABY83_04250 [Pseudomonadota bacterium]